MEGVLEILAHHRVHDMLSADHLLYINAERSLTHLFDLLPHLKVLNLIVDQGIDRQNRFKEVQRHFHFAVLYHAYQKMDTLLA